MCTRVNTAGSGSKDNNRPSQTPEPNRREDISMSDKAGRVVYWNGEFVPESEARISIYDSALMFGDMVFEMLRTFRGEQWKLREHLERLYVGLDILRIDIDMSIEEMETAVHQTVEANQPAFAEDDEHRILIDVSRGLLSLYHDIVGVHTGPNVIIADFPLRWTVVGCSHFYDKGINLITPSQRAIPASLLEPKIKNRSRMHYMMANIEVSLIAGSDNWALLLDPDGFVAEGTGSNFFLVKDGIIYTPEARNVLRGITRATIIEDLAPRLKIPVVEKNLETYDVHTADEAFLTSTPFCAVPATSYQGKPIGDGKPGPVTMSLMDEWSRVVGIDITGQIRDWDAAAADSERVGPSTYRFASANQSSDS
jgi:branched-chain amino acid aminotransferase